MLGTAPYPSRVLRSRPLYTLSYAFLRSRNTRKRESWSTLSKSCIILSSKIAFPIPLPSRKSCRTPWRQTLAFRRVSMIDSTTFQIYSNRPIPRVSVLPLGIRNSIFHPSSHGIYPCCHMNWVISTSFCHWYGMGVVGVISSGYASSSHLLKCSARSWVFPPTLWSCRCRTAYSTSPSKGTLSLTLNGVTWVGTSLPRGGGGFFPPIHHSVIPCDLGHVHPRGVRFPCVRVRYHLFRTVHAPWSLWLTVVGSKHALIFFVVLSTWCLYYTRKYLRTDFVRVRATFLLCHELWRRAVCSSINLVNVSDVHWYHGGEVSGGVGLDQGPSTLGIFCQKFWIPLDQGGVW